MENILRKPFVETLPRLQSLLFRLQKYDLKFKCAPEKKFIIADTLSRAHLSQTKQQTEEICEEIKTYKLSVFLPGIFIA